MACAYSVLHGDVATGKYKYVLGRLLATLTHPDGKLRVHAVEYGWQTAWHLLVARRYHGLEDVINSLPTFVYTHYSELYDEWERVCLDDEPQNPFAQGGNIDVDALPNITYESRLLENYKRKLMKDHEQHQI